MSYTLLQTKFFLPPTRPVLVQRPRLIAKLNAGLRGKLTLVAAPAGWGKTTLVADWLLQAEQPFAWLSLDPEDNDPTRLFIYLSAALQRVSGLGQRLEGLLQAPHSRPPQTLATALVHDVSEASERFVLALDDYHLITSDPLHETLTFLLDHLPPTMHLVLITRVTPPLPLPRLRVRGHLTEIGSTDLRFTPEEATHFLNQTMGLSLTSEDVRTLERRTEGWIAGIQMAALSLQGASAEHVQRFIKGFSGSHRYIFDYLTEEVLRQRPPGTRDFLLQTSILERMTAALCDAVLGLDDQPTDTPARLSSQLVLEELERANFFLVPLDDQRRWYRYHHLFADLLRQRLRQRYPERVATLHRRASLWFEQAGYPHEAIEHALAAGEHERVATLLEPIAPGMALRLEVYQLGRWIEALPKSLLLRYPHIVHPYAIILSVTNRYAEYARWLDLAEEAARTNPGHPDAVRILREVAVQRCIKAALFGEYDQALHAVEAAEALLQSERQPAEGWSLASIRGSALLQWRGEVAAAATALDEALRYAEAEAETIGTVICYAALAGLHLVTGRLHAARDATDTALRAATLPTGDTLPIVAYPQALMGRLCYEWNRLDEVETHLRGRAPLSGFSTDPITTFTGVMVRQAQGNPTGARAALAEAERRFRQLPLSSAFRQRLEAIRARLWLMQGQQAQAAAWADHTDLPQPEEPLRPVHAFAYGAWARVRLAQARFAEVDTFLTRLHAWAEQRGLHHITITSAMLLALSQHAQGEQAVALTHLHRALTLAEPGGYVRLFVDEGEPMRRLLNDAAARGVAPSYTAHLLHAFAPAPRPPTADLVEPLSEREVEVLRLVAAGLSNRQIAERLILAVGTVKRHLNNINGKLGTGSRMEAVAHARELNLLA